MRSTKELTTAELDALARERIQLFWGRAGLPEPDASRLRELMVDYARQVILRDRRCRESETAREPLDERIAALVEQWRQEAIRHKTPGDCYRVGQGWGMDQCADELETLLRSGEPKE